MYVKVGLQPVGIGLAYDSKNQLVKDIFLSNKDSRVSNFTWLRDGRWNNSGGKGWYTVGPLNLLEWSEE